MSTSTESDWKSVGNNNPCIVCGGKRKCTAKLNADGDGVVKCCKQSAGAFRSSRDSVGEAHFHRIKANKPIVAIEPPELPAEKLHQVYAYLLSRLISVAPRHLDNLRKRGLSDSAIQKNGYRTIHAAAARSLAGELWAQFGDEIKSVPGVAFWEDDKPHVNYPYVEKTPINDILLIPCRDKGGRIVALKQRIDDPKWDGEKYLYLSSGKHGGRKAVQSVHLPKGTPATCDRVRVTEGELKADAAWEQTGIVTIAIPGVGSWRKVLPVVLELGATEVILAFDADAKTNPHVAGPLLELYKDLHQAGLTITLEYWDIALGKGIDDLLAGGSQPSVATGPVVESLIAQWVQLTGADKISTTQAEITEIFCFLDEERVINQVIPELAKVTTIFQRGGALVHVVHEADTCSGIMRQANAPTIAHLPEIGLRIKLSAICKFQENTEDGPKAVRVPHWVTKAVHQLGEWRGVRRLESVVTYPVIRADGSIVHKQGYDPQTGLFLDISDSEIEVPERPTQEDARKAVEKLRDLVCDFPFESPEHFSSWLSLLLTILSRFAFSGPSPLFVVDANTRGSGKTLLAELASIIITGQDFARMTNPRDDEEIRKRITAIALRGDPLVLIDNVAGDLGSPSLDSALTSTSWSDRVLGQSDMTTLPLYTTWVATGNNISLAADTSRRVCHIRLQSPEERPEERTAFRYPNVIQYARENRFELLSAALTILKGFYCAGRPTTSVKPWGSFEGWSQIVRQAVIWAGEPDPGNAREALVQNADSEVGVIHDLIRGWEIADPETEGLTISRLLEMLEFNSEQFSKLKTALTELCGSPNGKLPSSKAIGKKLSYIRCRVIEGKFIESKLNRAKTKAWYVKNINEKSENKIAEIESQPQGDIFS